MAFDHVSYAVQMSKFDAEINFLVTTLAPLGVKAMARPFHGVTGLGDRKPWLWVSALEDREPIGDEVRVLRNHIAFAANGVYSFLGFEEHACGKVWRWGALISLTMSRTDRAQVDEFHAAAVKAGGKDNGAPGVRAHYHSNYYAAFVISPSGHNLECVTHTSTG